VKLIKLETSRLGAFLFLEFDEESTFLCCEKKRKIWSTRNHPYNKQQVMEWLAENKVEVSMKHIEILGEK
jgi:hypothetical protein